MQDITKKLQELRNAVNELAQLTKNQLSRIWCSEWVCEPNLAFLG